MKQFVTRSLITIAVLLLVLAGLETYARHTDDSSLRLRRDYFEANKDQLDGLVFGPSLILRAINPDLLDYNTALLAMNGSTPGVDYLLFQRFINETQPKFIIMDLSVGYVDRGVKGDYFEQNRMYHYFGVRGKKWEIKDLFLIRPPFYKMFSEVDSMDVQTLNQYGFALQADLRSDQFRQLNYDTSEIAQLPSIQKKIRRHNRTNDRRYQRNLDYYREIAATCAERGISLIFVSPPKYYTVDGKLSEKHYQRRAKLLDELNEEYENIYFWNFDSMHPYQATLFLDSNHSSPLGAVKVSEAINQRLQQLFN